MNFIVDIVVVNCIIKKKIKVIAKNWRGIESSLVCFIGYLFLVIIGYFIVMNYEIDVLFHQVRYEDELL